MRKFLSAVSLLALMSSPALAVSGHGVSDNGGIKVLSSAYPNCVQFFTADGDPTAYGVSTNSATYRDAMDVLNTSKMFAIWGVEVPVTFVTVAPTADCPSPIVPVTKLQ